MQLSPATHVETAFRALRLETPELERRLDQGLTYDPAQTPAPTQSVLTKTWSPS